MTLPANISAIEKATGRPWSEWRTFLDSVGAHDLPHKEIVERVYATGNVSGWWSQMITVAYEQHLGRRVPGQTCDGDFQASASRTVSGGLDEMFARFASFMAGRTHLSDIEITRGPDTSSTEKWRYWRCGLGDGSRVVVNLCLKAPGKTLAGVSHEKLDSPAQVEHWQGFWRETLKAL